MAKLTSPWFKIEPSKLLIHTMNMNEKEKSDFLTKLLTNLILGESDEPIINEIIEERLDYIDKKKNAGRIGGSKPKQTQAVLKQTEANASKTKHTPSHNITEHNITEHKEDKSSYNISLAEKFLEIWNETSWTKKYNPTQRTKARIGARIKLQMSTHTKTYLDDIKAKLAVSEALREANWFTPLWLYDSTKNSEKFLSGYYDFLAKKDQDDKKTDYSKFYSEDDII